MAPKRSQRAPADGAERAAFKKAVGKRIRVRREALGLNTETLAGQIGTSRNRLSTWENGKGSPDLYGFFRLVRVIGLGADVLLGLAAETEALGAEISRDEFEALEARLRVVEGRVGASAEGPEPPVGPAADRSPRQTPMQQSGARPRASPRRRTKE
jgi:transcriptional regulator with XRE-family HTH domain